MRIVLFEPEIPHNTGAIARLCVATKTPLHLVGRLGFRIDDARVRRAGLDYWEHVQLHRHADWTELTAAIGDQAWFYFTTKANQSYTEARYPVNSVLIFGSESRGLPASRLADPSRCWRIPILDERVRSLNLATAVGIVLYEALRQQT